MCVTNAPTYVLSFLQDLDATASLALKIKQEPFTSSSGQIYGEYTECCLVVDKQRVPMGNLRNPSLLIGDVNRLLCTCTVFLNLNRHSAASIAIEARNPWPDSYR
jgi:hypothetical protein